MAIFNLQMLRKKERVGLEDRANEEHLPVIGDLALRRDVAGFAPEPEPSPRSEATRVTAQALVWATPHVDGTELAGEAGLEYGGHEQHLAGVCAGR